MVAVTCCVGAASSGPVGAGAVSGRHPSLACRVARRLVCLRTQRPSPTCGAVLMRPPPHPHPCPLQAGAEGKRLRSTMLLLMSSALAPAPPSIEVRLAPAACPAAAVPDAPPPCCGAGTLAHPHRAAHGMACPLAAALLTCKQSQGQQPPPTPPCISHLPAPPPAVPDCRPLAAGGAPAQRAAAAAAHRRDHRTHPRGLAAAR